MKKLLTLTLLLLTLGIFAPFLGYQFSSISLLQASGLHKENNLSNALNTEQTNPSAPTMPTQTTSPFLSESNPFANNNPNSTNQMSNNTLSPSQSNTSNTTLAPLYIQDESTGEILEVSVRDYLIGAVASEMPMTWTDAALKAQAIATHSYILYCKNHTDPTAYDGAYLSADPARRQGFMTDSVLRSYWGTSYESNYARLSALIDEVLDIVVLYENEAAATSYFAISNGKTESSDAVWGQALPYLVSVNSEEDKNADGYAQTISYTRQEVHDILYTALGIDTEGVSPDAYFNNFSYTDAGYVQNVTVCGIDTSGIALRSVFALRSACFQITYTDDCFQFTTLGYGHGVGFSQWGAELKGRAGLSTTDILSHYFPNTQLGSALALEA